MKLDATEKFKNFCLNAGIYFRDRKNNFSDTKLVGTAGVVLREGNKRCKVYFGKDVQEEIVTGLFDALAAMDSIYALELYDLPFIPMQIEKLIFLEDLEIYSKYIVNLPDEMRKLANLTALSLRMENLQELPEWIVSFEKLEILDLYGTRIDHVPDNINNLKKLKVLDLCCTHLKKMPCTILDLNLQFKVYFNENDAPGIYFCDSTCENPSTEIIHGGRERMEFYYKSNSQVAQNRVRVILLGQKGSGKTSMVQRLRELADGGSYFSESNVWTQGISINNLSCDNGTLHVWDFGGQEMMLSTHTLFLRDHCIYIIVLNARQGDEPERWLDYINQFGKNSSVFIVNNHMDVADISQIDINKIKRLYPDLSINSDRIWETSCMKPEEYPLDELYRQILVSADNYFNQTISFSWSELNTKLSDMKENGESVDYITHEDYLKICEECGIFKLKEKIDALNWLNEIGTVFTYGNPQALDKVNELKILRPVWVTDAIYKIINYNASLKEDTCQIFHDQIRDALMLDKGENQTTNEYTDSEIVFILEVMRKFDLSFQCSEMSEFIPAVAKNVEFIEVNEWLKEPETIILDILYILSRINIRNNHESSVNLAYFYQVIINIVKDFGMFPRMWRFGALFENLYDGMQVLLFLQDKGKWSYELHLMVKSNKGEEARIPAAQFHQCIMSYLKKIAINDSIDASVLIGNGKDVTYFSVNDATNMLLHNQKYTSISAFDEQIDLYSDVLMKVAPDYNNQLREAIDHLSDEVAKGNRQMASAVDTLNQIVGNVPQVLSQMVKYESMLNSIKAYEEIGLERYSQAIYDSNELKVQLQVISDSSKLQENEITLIKCLLEELSHNNGKKQKVVGIVKKVLEGLSMGVTFATADYGKLENLHKMYEILFGLMKNVIDHIPV